MKLSSKTMCRSSLISIDSNDVRLAPRACCKADCYAIKGWASIRRRTSFCRSFPICRYAFGLEVPFPKKITCDGAVFLPGSTSCGVLHDHDFCHVAKLAKVLAQSLGACLPAQTADKHFTANKKETIITFFFKT